MTTTENDDSTDYTGRPGHEYCYPGCADDPDFAPGGRYHNPSDRRRRRVRLLLLDTHTALLGMYHTYHIGPPDPALLKLMADDISEELHR